MPEIITSTAREIGRLHGANGHPVMVSVDRDAVTVWAPLGAILGAAERDHFMRLFWQAEREAEAWAKEHAGAGDG